MRSGYIVAPDHICITPLKVLNTAVSYVPRPPISHHFSFNTPVLKDNKYTQMRDISIKSVCGETFIEVRPS